MNQTKQNIKLDVLTIHKESNKTLSEIREEYMLEQELKEIQE